MVKNGDMMKNGDRRTFNLTSLEEDSKKNGDRRTFNLTSLS